MIELLRRGELEILGRLVDSSNGALLVEVHGGGASALAIHKPIASERPLWDFPHGHLAWREVAAFLVAEAAGLPLVPPTVLRDGPRGSGSIQLWVADPPSEDGPGTETDALVRVTAPDDVPTGWLAVLAGQGDDGTEVVLAHSPDQGVADLALLDALLNNTDRKGGHVVRAHGQVWGFDHGLTLGAEPKLRTVLWGWAGAALTERDQEALTALRTALASGPLPGALAALLTPGEVAALSERCARLEAAGRRPIPSRHWPAIPWPAL